LARRGLALAASIRSREGRDKTDRVVALSPDYRSHQSTEVIENAGPRFVQRRAFANALWLSTALTGLATPKRTRYTRWSPDIWKRFSLDSANVTGTPRLRRVRIPFLPRLWSFGARFHSHPLQCVRPGSRGWVQLQTAGFLPLLWQ